jgi:hypothetical protein
MRVILQRNLFMGGVRYRRDRNGTELPDEVTQIMADGSHLTKKLELWRPDPENEGKQHPDQARAVKEGKCSPPSS